MEIREYKINPSDDGSRAFQSDRWLKGPEFLWNDQSTWYPRGPYNFNNDDTDLEIKRDVLLKASVEENHAMARLVSHYSSWKRLVRAVAWLRRFLKYLAVKIVQNGSHLPLI